MPRRSLNSSVFRWPSEADVLAAARAWAQEVGSGDANVQRIVCFGSLVNGRWGVGSDLDLFIEVSATDLPFMQRSIPYDVSSLPVPADVIVHTSDEVRRQRVEKRRFAREIDERGLILYRRDDARPAAVS